MTRPIHDEAPQTPAERAHHQKLAKERRKAQLDRMRLPDDERLSDAEVALEYSRRKRGGLV